jgi:hypothetical protein
MYLAIIELDNDFSKKTTAEFETFEFDHTEKHQIGAPEYDVPISDSGELRVLAIATLKDLKLAKPDDLFGTVSLFNADGSLFKTLNI